MNQSGGLVGQHPIIISKNLIEESLDTETALAVQINTARNNYESKILETVLLHKANKENHGSMFCQLDNNCTLRGDYYPTIGNQTSTE